MIAAINRYSNEQLVGKGAYGEVFVAMDSLLRRQVAIKRYYKSIDGLAQVLDAVKHWSKLNHPNIAQLLDFSSKGDELLLVMTYCEGGSLDQCVSDFKLDQERVAKLFQQLASAVEYLHSHGLLHRDLKLANVLLDSTGSPVLIDLDFCTPSDSTDPSSKVGTPDYMAPELLASINTNTCFTDQYAMGVMLFEMLSGQMITPGAQFVRGPATFELARTIANYRDWNAIIARATNADPKMRYSKVSHFAEDVDRLMCGEPVSVRKLSLAERGIRWIRRNPFTASMLTVVVTALLAGSFSSLHSWNQSTHSRDRILLNTELLNQRIKEANRQKNELDLLLSKVQQEYLIAESSKKEQELVTQAAEASQQKWQAEAARSKKLTDELDSLLVKAKTSTDAAIAASKERDDSTQILAIEQDRSTKIEYANKVEAIWASVLVEDWDEAKRKYSLIPIDSKGLEFKILSNAITNKLRKPVRIEIGVAANRPSSVIYKHSTSYVSYDIERSDNRILEILKDSESVKANLLYPIRGSLSFELGSLGENEKIVGMLNDGSLLIAEHEVNYSVLTFSPRDFTASTTRLSTEMENKINLSQLSLKSLSLPSDSNIALKSIDLVPITLDQSEIQAWRYFAALDCKIVLSSDNRNIEKIETTSQNAFDVNAFRFIKTLQNLNFLNFAHSGITDKCVADLSSLKKLQHLNLWNTSQVSDDGIRQLKELPSLEFLNIGLTKASLEAIDHSLLKNLVTLYLNGTRLSSSRLTKLSACTKLDTLSVFSMNIKDEDLQVLKGIESLKILEIGPSSVTDRGIDIIEGMLNLQQINLQGTLGPLCCHNPESNSFATTDPIVHS